MNFSTNIRKQPILVLAPHLHYPTHTGADILIDRRWRNIANYFPYADFVTQNYVIRFQMGEVEILDEFSNDRREKISAAIRTLLIRSHYLREVFLTPAFKSVASEKLQEDSYGLIVCSYIFTAEWVHRTTQCDQGHIAKRPLIVETHNDEVLWYQNLSARSPNPFVWLVASQSIRWGKKAMQSLQDGPIFIHVTAKDKKAYSKLIPRHKGHIAPVGHPLRLCLSTPRFCPSVN